jgi:uncharacterized protein YbjT (DUF2867 family)
MNPQFRVIVIGGTGQVGSAVVQALLAESVCREVVMVQRDIGKAFVAEIDKKAAETGVAFYDNQGMRKRVGSAPIRYGRHEG